jgi:hypothetical protein
MSLALQANSGAENVGGGGTLNVAFGSGNTSGSTIIVLVITNAPGGSAGTVAVTDSKGNSYSTLLSQTSPGSNMTCSAYIASGVAAGSNTVHVAHSANICGVIILEYPSSIGITTLDKSANQASSGTAVSSTATATTTQSNELLIAWGASLANHTFTAGGSFAIETAIVGGAGGLMSMFAEDQQVSSTGAYTGTATMSVSDSYNCTIATLKITGGSGPAPSPVVCIMT